MVITEAIHTNWYGMERVAFGLFVILEMVVNLLFSMVHWLYCLGSMAHLCSYSQEAAGLQAKERKIKTIDQLLILYF